MKQNRMETLRLNKIGENQFQGEILSWYFSWDFINFTQKNVPAYPAFKDLEKKALGYGIPEVLKKEVLRILKDMSINGFTSGRMVVDVDVEFIADDPLESEGLIGEITTEVTTFSAAYGRVTAGYYNHDYYRILKIGAPRWLPI